MRQRLRRPLRYGSSLKRASLAPTLNKMPGPSSVLARQNPSAMLGQSTMVNITWPPEEDGNGTGSLVLQVRLDGQQQQPTLQNDTPPPSVRDPDKPMEPVIATGESCTTEKRGLFAT